MKKLITTKLTANKTRYKKVTNTWDISTNEIQQIGINKEKQRESYKKNELKKEKNILSSVK